MGRRLFNYESADGRPALGSRGRGRVCDDAAARPRAAAADPWAVRCPALGLPMCALEWAEPSPRRPPLLGGRGGANGIS